MSVGIPTLILAVIVKQCHKQANKRFGGRLFAKNQSQYARSVSAPNRIPVE